MYTCTGHRITNLMHQSSLPEDELSPASQIVLEHNHIISELQEQLPDLAATQGSLLLADAEQEKKEGRVLKFVRDKLHHQAGHFQTLESMNVKLRAEVVVLREWQMSIEVLQGGEVDVADEGDVEGVVEVEFGAGRWELEV
jgi:uncharacterized coiled-coil protein SlyX